MKNGQTVYSNGYHIPEPGSLIPFTVLVFSINFASSTGGRKSPIKCLPSAASVKVFAWSVNN